MTKVRQRAQKMQKVMLNWIENPRFQEIISFYSDKHLLEHLAMFKVNLTNDMVDVVHIGHMENFKNIINSGYSSYENLLYKIMNNLDLLSEKEEISLFFDRRILMHRFCQGQINDEIEFICLFNTVFRWVHCDYLLLDSKDDGCIYAYIFVFDMSDYIKKQETIKDTAIESEIDSLTGLPNRLFFRSVAPEILKKNIKKGKKTSFVHFDIENFKAFNEKYGANSGDKLLKFMGEVLSNVFSECLVSHLSQDHFMVVTSENDIISKIEDIHNCIADFSKLEYIEVKAGIFETKDEELDAFVASDRAKIAADSIKNKYTEVYRFFDEELVNIVTKQKYIVDNIDNAIKRKDLRVYYQPVFCTKTGTLSGFEALSRWKDPTYGFLSPADYIVTLEEYRLIHKLDQFMIKSICRDIRFMLDEGFKAVPVSVNLSRIDFELGDMVTYLDKCVEKYNIDKSLVHVEITETVLMENPNDLKFQIEKFQNRGFEVWMDDFGSGYSSFNVLKDFDFDMLKIDMLFMKDFEKNKKAKKILAAIVEMAKTIGISTVAEGVETQEQFEFLRTVGCDRAQGYLFGKPTPMNDEFFDFFTKTMR
ncbi:EAL domain-containing protein [Lachnobacterium bovis]|uniref:bifunctional diguanylate cyclase/phosphodiesterase n=1 Tax=Lachnobacterium bovis TaxID=140626 RepID=UPI00068BAB70|nr:GGDEF domain-containing phosphodiesterase [Lachnobacterium bovis]